MVTSEFLNLGASTHFRPYSRLPKFVSVHFRPPENLLSIDSPPFSDLQNAPRKRSSKGWI